MKLFERYNAHNQGIKKTIAICLITVISALSFNYSAVAENNIPQEKMVMIADHALHTMSLGEGEFTVIFESGFGNDLSHWRSVAPAVSKKAKVVVYSRAGYGKSDPVSKARTLTQTTSELSQFIETENLQPPFILVGHSYGAHIMRAYAAQQPNNVAGFVFVDPANEAFMLKLKQLDKTKTEDFLKVYDKMIPKRLRAQSEMLKAIDEKGSLPDFGPLPDVPTVVLTSMVQEHPQFIIHSMAGKKLWRELHSKLFNQFSMARHITTMNSGHNIAIQEPALVIEAIETIIEQASRISQKKHLANALKTATTLITQAEQTQAESMLFSALKRSSLKSDKINTLGYQYLSAKNKASQNKTLAAMILKYNMLNNPNSANAFDSYGESLLALNLPEQAKIQFLEAIKLTVKKSKNHRALKGFKANLAKAELAINKAQ